MFFKFLAEREVDRVIKVVTDEAAGAIKVEAEALAAEERERAAAADGAMAGADLMQHMEIAGRGVSFSQPGCLVSFVGVERVLGAPFRVIDDFTRLGEADLEWVRARVGELSQEVMCLYAHLGLESADALARELLHDPSKFDTDVPKALSPRIASPPNWRILHLCCHLVLCVTT